MAFGNLIASIVLVLFYVTVFAVVAIPFRLATNVLGNVKPDSNFRAPRKHFSQLEDFQSEA